MAEPLARPSRWPVYVTVVFFTIAISLVLLALRGPPPPEVVIESPGTAGAPRQVTVILRDYAFDPTPLVLVRGETVSFVVLNGGLQPHEFVLGDAAVQDAWAAANAAATPPAPFATAPLASAPPEVGGVRLVVGSGQQAEQVWQLPATGELLLMCHLPGHVEEGMVGRVELRDAPPRSGTQAAIR